MYNLDTIEILPLMTNLANEFSVSIDPIETPQFIPIPRNARYAERLWVDLRIVNRPNSVGAVNLEQLCPRQWSGYYYLFHQNKIIKSGAIEFENQRLIYLENEWKAEIATLTYGVEFSSVDVPTGWDTTVDDEPDEFAVYSALGDTSEPSKYYLPKQLPVDFIGLWFPSGVILKCNISWLQYSPLTIIGPNNDIDIYEENEDGTLKYLKDDPAPLFPFSGIGTNTQKSFDDIARDKGYILSSECYLKNESELDDIARNNGYIQGSECQLLTSQSLRDYANSRGYYDSSQWNEMSGLKRVTYSFVWNGNQLSPTTFTYLGVLAYDGFVKGSWGSFSPVIYSHPALTNATSLNYVFLRFSLSTGGVGYVRAAQWFLSQPQFQEITNVQTTIVNA